MIIIAIGSSHSLVIFLSHFSIIYLFFTPSLAQRVFVFARNEVQLTFCENKTNICSNKFARIHRHIHTHTHSRDVCMLFVSFVVVFSIHLLTVHACSNSRNNQFWNGNTSALPTKSRHYPKHQMNREEEKTFNKQHVDHKIHWQKPDLITFSIQLDILHRYSAFLDEKFFLFFIICLLIRCVFFFKMKMRMTQFFETKPFKPTNKQKNSV